MTEDDAPQCGPVRVLMKEGRWLVPVAQRPRLRPAPPDAPVKRRGHSFAAEVVGLNRQELLGRPARYSHLKPEIQKLRAEGCSWPEVGRRLKINPEAARMVVMERKRA